MHPCAWYLAIPGTTRTETVPAPAAEEGSGSRSLAEVVSAEVEVAGLVLAGLLADGVVPPLSAAAVLPESDASLGTVVSAGLRPVGVTGGVADGALTTVSADAGLSVGGFGGCAGNVLRTSVGRSAARARSVRGWLALGGPAWADSAFGALARDAAASG